jgi:microcompartment protein CcmL/EutN
MNRNELVKAALEAGITKANTMKSVVLEEMLNNLNVEKVVKRGRPVNENSVRQKRLIELEEKRNNGELKRGRPVNSESVRQQRLNELESKRINGELRLGRPVNENSVRQMRLKDLEERRLNGTLKRGRPKMIKTEE